MSQQCQLRVMTVLAVVPAELAQWLILSGCAAANYIAGLIAV